MEDMFPVTMQARRNKMAIGQRGLFYDPTLKTLIIGLITESGLKGRVIHDGSKSNEDWLSAAYHVGYTYPKWSMHDMEYVGKLRMYTSHREYDAFLKDASSAQIKAIPLVLEQLKEKKRI